MLRPNAALLDRRFHHWVPLLLAFLLSGCSSLGYYGQLAQGQMSLLAKRESVDRLVADPSTPEPLRARLVLSQQARTFASQSLALPDNRSYRVYADLGRRYVVWNLFATDEFSLEPITHCFPIAGCVAYRGFYDENRARGAAAVLQQQGKDTYVAGIEAYSTLGWFDDPLLNTMLEWNQDRLVALIFHELAHQQFYLPGDTAFNESFATFVEREGLKQWQAAQGRPAHGTRHAQRDQFVALVLGLRERLELLYRQPIDAPTMRSRKREHIERFRHEYRQLQRQQWAGDRRFDNWVYAPLNNARLLPFGLYDRWVPAFATLYENAGRDWPAFYEAVHLLGGKTPDQRNRTLEALVRSR
jgi:predicted aminopeptidase